MVFAVGIGEEDHLFYCVDMEDVAEVDDVLTAYTDEETVVCSKGMKTFFHFGKTEGNHEMRSRDICHVGIMIVSLHIQHAVAMNHIHLVIRTQYYSHTPKDKNQYKGSKFLDKNI